MEIINYFIYKPRYNGTFSRNILPRIRDGAYVIYHKKTKESHWVSLFIDKHTGLKFDSLKNENIPKDVLNKIRDKSITHNIFRIQNNDSIMCALYCIAFIKVCLQEKLF